MEKQSVFERFANRFSGCQVEIRRGKDSFDWDKSDEMFTVGEALFAKIKSKEIDLVDIPDWFTKEPKGWAIDSTGQDRQFCSWDLYWLSAIKWLAENKPDSAIAFPRSIGRIKPGEHLYSEKGVTGLLITLLHLRNENLRRAWLGLAKASEDACSYLAQISKEPAEATHELVTYEPAKILAEAYNLPIKRVRSELSKEYWGPGGAKANNPKSPQLRNTIEDAGGKDTQYLWRTELVKPILEKLAKKHIEKH